MHAYQLKNRHFLSSISSPRDYTMFKARAMSNDMEGLRELVDHMMGQVHEFSADPIVWRTTRTLSRACGIDEMRADKERTDCQIKTLFTWMQSNFMYLNDPTGKEVIVSPVRMLKDLQTPPNVLSAILGPVLKDQILGAKEFQISGEEVFQLNKVGLRGCMGLGNGRFG